MQRFGLSRDHNGRRAIDLVPVATSHAGAHMGSCHAISPRIYNLVHFGIKVKKNIVHVAR